MESVKLSDLQVARGGVAMAATVLRPPHRWGWWTRLGLVAVAWLAGRWLADAGIWVWLSPFLIVGADRLLSRLTSPEPSVPPSLGG